MVNQHNGNLNFFLIIFTRFKLLILILLEKVFHINYNPLCIAVSKSGIKIRKTYSTAIKKHPPATPTPPSGST